jgi:AraC-like DNA-binding protein
MKSSRENVPSSRADLSMTGTCGAIPWVLTSQSRLAASSTFRVDVENAIAPLLPHGTARVPEIARRLGMSPRTLARRLAEEGLTFSTVLEGLRMDLARHYLQDEDLPISKIAWLLGYGEVSAFTHAYKRWTNRTPREARASEKRLVSPVAFDRGRPS